MKLEIKRKMETFKKKRRRKEMRINPFLKRKSSFDKSRGGLKVLNAEDLERTSPCC